MWSQYDENLKANPFFQEILNNHEDIMKRASEEAWIICVPRVGSLENCEININAILDHILIAKDDNCNYSTLSKKLVEVQEKQIKIDKSNVMNPVNILFEETFYIEKSLRYTVWCIDKPLFLEYIACETDLKTNLTSLHNCVDFLWSVTYGHEIFNEIQRICRTFLQENDNFQLESLQTQKDLLGSVYSQCLQVAFKNQHISEQCNKSVQFLEKLKIAIETYMQHCFNKKLLLGIGTNLCEQEAHFNKIIQNSSDLQLRDLNISTDFCEVIMSAKCQLNKLNHYTTITDKLSCLKSTFNIISTKQKANTDSKVITSDVLLQIFVFLILKLNLNNWISNFTFLTQFQFCSLNFTDENKFLLTTLEAAIEFIKSCEFLEIKIRNLCDNSDESSHFLVNNLFKETKLGNLTYIDTLFNEIRLKDTELESLLCHPLCSCKECTKLVDDKQITCNINLNSLNDKEQTLLHIATIYEHSQIVEYLLSKNDINVNFKDCHGRSPLHYAALKGIQDVLLILLDSNVDINIKDNNGNTPLILASNNGHDNCVKALLYSNKDVNVNSCNTYGDTALHLASKWGFLSIVQILLCFNAFCNLKNKRNKSALDLAHNAHVVRMIKHFSSYTFENVCGESPEDLSNLSIHSTQSNQMISDLSSTDYGVRPKNIEQLKRIDLLIKSIVNNDLPLTSFYLGFRTSNDANESFESENKCHPLCNCDKCDILENDFDIISVQKDVNNFSVNTCNVDGYTSLHIAAKFGRIEILGMLLDSGALPNLKTYRHTYTPLHLACIFQRMQAVKELLKTTCNVNEVDIMGNTPLYYACLRNDGRIVELLLRNGADCNIKNKQGITAWQEVQNKMLFGIFKLLRNYKTTDNEKNSDAFI